MSAPTHDSLDHTVLDKLPESIPGFRPLLADGLAHTTGDLLVGRLLDGERVYVHIQLSEYSKVKQSIEHEQVQRYVRLSITGHTVEPGKQGLASAGQITDTVAELAHDWTLAEGVTRESLLHLVAVWRAWHLNDLRAGCAHQDVVYETSSYGAKQPSLTATKFCPLSGYRYGSAWLLRPLEARVVAFLSEFAVQVR